MQTASALMQDPFVWKSLVGLVGAGWLLDRIGMFIVKTRERVPVDKENGNVTRKRVEDLCRSMDRVATGLSELTIHFKYSVQTQKRNTELLEGIHIEQTKRNASIEEFMTKVGNQPRRETG